MEKPAKKLPAHELILSWISSVINEWGQTSMGRSNTHTEFLLCRIELLCLILADMLIPENVHEEVIGKIRELIVRHRVVTDTDKIFGDRLNEVLRKLGAEAA